MYGSNIFMAQNTFINLVTHVNLIKSFGKNMFPLTCLFRNYIQMCCRNKNVTV